MKLFLLTLAMALPAQAETIDRIAVSIGNRVITTSDIERQIRVAAFLSGAKPDLSPKARREAAERLVDQRLIASELETARYPEPAPAELDKAFADFKAKFYPTPEQYRAALAASGVSEAEVKEQLHWARRWNSFVTARFRPSTNISDREISDYFDKTVAPAARQANPGASISLDAFRERIADKLLNDRIDEQTNQWLESARKQTEIVFHDEAFE